MLPDAWSGGLAYATRCLVWWPAHTTRRMVRWPSICYQTTTLHHVFLSHNTHSPFSNSHYYVRLSGECVLVLNYFSPSRLTVLFPLLPSFVLPLSLPNSLHLPTPLRHSLPTPPTHPLSNFPPIPPTLPPSTFTFHPHSLPPPSHPSLILFLSLILLTYPVMQCRYQDEPQSNEISS